MTFTFSEIKQNLIKSEKELINLISEEQKIKILQKLNSKHKGIKQLIGQFKKN